MKTYSVAYNSDLSEDMTRKSEAIAFAKKVIKQGARSVIINVQDENGNLIDVLKIVDGKVVSL